MGIDANLTGKAMSAVPIGTIIAQPLTAYLDANIQNVQKQEEVSESMYFNKDGSQRSLYTESKSHETLPDGSIKEKTFLLKIPRLLAEANGVRWKQFGKGIKTSFRMEINQSFSQEDAKSGAGGFEGEGKAGYGPVSVKVKVHGSFSASSKTSSTSSIKSVWDIETETGPSELSPVEAFVIEKMVSYCEPVAIDEKIISADDLKKEHEASKKGEEPKEKSDKKK